MAVDVLDLDVVLDALGDPTRRRIVQRLRTGPLAVGDLAAGLPVSRPAVSQHLRVLGRAGLVRRRSQGTRNLYALAPDGLEELRRWLDDMWGDVLAGFAAHARAGDELEEERHG
jgi:DNA-binding transcriptional ArsR family regulator